MCIVITQGSVPNLVLIVSKFKKYMSLYCFSFYANDQEICYNKGPIVSCAMIKEHIISPVMVQPRLKHQDAASMKEKLHLLSLSWTALVVFNHVNHAKESPICGITMGSGESYQTTDLAFW